MTINFSQSSVSGSWFDITSDSTGQYLLACSIYNGLWRSTNFGVNWTNITSNNSNLQNCEKVCSNSTGQYIVASVSYGQYLLLSNNYGSTWSIVLSNVRFNSITANSTGQYFVGVTFGGDIWVSTNYGSTWSNISLTDPLLKNINHSQARCIASSATGQYVYVNGFLYSTDYGITWNLSTIRQDFWSITTSENGKFVAGCQINGDIWVSNDYGVTWLNMTSSIPSLHNHFWNSINCNSTGQYLVACYSESDYTSEVFISSDYGTTWECISNNIDHDRGWRKGIISYSGTKFTVIHTAGIYLGTIDNSIIPSSNICFPAGTHILTNEGYIPIEKIDPKYNTIRNQQIIAITKSTTNDKYLVCFEKDSINNNIPSQKTIISKNHAILHYGSMIKAKDFIGRFENVKKIKYNGEILYNVLLKTHDKMIVNNLICETLNPNHGMAILYRYLLKLNENEKQQLLEKVKEYSEKYNTLKIKKLKN